MATVSRGPDEDEDLLREAAEKAERLAEQLMADAAAIKGDQPAAADKLGETAKDAQDLAKALHDSVPPKKDTPA